jgi:hypothetical protein
VCGGPKIPLNLDARARRRIKDPLNFCSRTYCKSFLYDSGNIVSQIRECHCCLYMFLGIVSRFRGFE